MDDVLKGLVRDELGRVSDSGELASRSRLREQLGIGANDLDTALAELCAEGVATEVEPDGYRLVPDEDVWTGLGAPVETPEPGVSLAEAERAGTPRPRAGAAAVPRERPAAAVSMPRAMVDAMEPAVLGGILKAGIESAQGEAFVFEVTL
jgi:biotin operon repressor